MDAQPVFGEGLVCLSEEPVPGPLGRKSWWRIVRWAGVVLIGGVLGGSFASFVLQRNRAFQREQCAARLTRLGVALHKYHEAYGHFPAPAIAAPDGTPLLSWRVAILPQLGYRSLYERFRLDEPWSSPHNRALIAEMPPELACPGGPGRSSGRTGYLVVVGPTTEPSSVNTPFEPTRGVDLREITDGTSGTALVFETDELIPWTKPEDFHWVEGGAPPRLSTPHGDGTHVLFADGSTRILKPTLRREVLLAILTINGGEISGG